MSDTDLTDSHEQHPANEPATGPGQATGGAYGALLHHTPSCRENTVGVSVGAIREARTQPATRAWAVTTPAAVDAATRLADEPGSCTCGFPTAHTQTRLLGRGELDRAAPRHVRITLDDFDAYLHQGHRPG